MSPLLRGRPAVIAAAVLVAAVVNLAIYGIGRLAGGTYRFTTSGAPLEVDPVTLAGFSTLPLAAGLTLAALLSARWTWVIPVAMVVAPVLELGSILGMTVPADFDLPSRIALMSCHAALVPISLVALLAIGRRARVTRRAPSPQLA
jgi:hypothetical protein